MSHDVTNPRESPFQPIRLYLYTVYGIAVGVWIALRIATFLPDILETILRPILFASLFFAPLAAARVNARDKGDRFYHRINILPVDAWKCGAILAATLALFFVSYAIAGIVGAATPDWSVERLVNINPNLFNPGTITFFAIAVSVVVVLPLFTALALPFEIGWRVYVLPKLLDRFSRIQTHVLLGLLAATAAFPAVMEGPLLMSVGAMIRFCAFAIVFSILLGEIMRLTDHVGLCAFTIGCYLSQVSGVWQFIYPESSPWFSGNLGLIPILACAIPATILYRRSVKKKVKRAQPKHTEIRRAPRRVKAEESAPTTAAPTPTELPQPATEANSVIETEAVPVTAEATPEDEAPDETAMPEIDIAFSETPKESPKPKAEPDRPIELAPLGPSEEESTSPPAVVDLPEPPAQLDLIEPDKPKPKPKKKSTTKKKTSTRKKKATAKKKAPKKKPAKKKATKKRATKKKPAKKKAAKKKPTKKKPAKKKSSGS